MERRRPWAATTGQARAATKGNKEALGGLEANWQPGILTNYTTKSIQALSTIKEWLTFLLEDIKREARLSRSLVYLTRTGYCERVTLSSPDYLGDSELCQSRAYVGRKFGVKSLYIDIASVIIVVLGFVNDDKDHNKDEE